MKNKEVWYSRARYGLFSLLFVIMGCGRNDSEELSEQPEKAPDAVVESVKSPKELNEQPEKVPDAVVESVENVENYDDLSDEDRTALWDELRGKFQNESGNGCTDVVQICDESTSDNPCQNWFRDREHALLSSIDNSLFSYPTIPSNSGLRQQIENIFNEGKYWDDEYEKQFSCNSLDKDIAIFKAGMDNELTKSESSVQSYLLNLHKGEPDIARAEYLRLSREVLPSVQQAGERIQKRRKEFILEFEQFLVSVQQQADTLIQSHLDKIADTEAKSLEIAKSTEIKSAKTAEQCGAERELRAKADNEIDKDQSDDRASYPPLSPFDWHDNFESVIDKICSLELIPLDAAVQINTVFGSPTYDGTNLGNQFTKANLCDQCDLDDFLIPQSGGSLVKVNEKTLFVAPAVIHVEQMNIAGYPFEATFYFTIVNDYPNLDWSGISSDWGWECMSQGIAPCTGENAEFKAELGVGYYLENLDKLSGYSYSQEKYSQFKTGNPHLDFRFHTETGSDGNLPIDEEIYFAMPLMHVSVKSVVNYDYDRNEGDSAKIARFNAYFTICESLEAKSYPRKVLTHSASHELIPETNEVGADCRRYKDIDPNDPLIITIQHEGFRFFYRPTEELQESYLNAAKASGWGVMAPSNEGIEKL